MTEQANPPERTDYYRQNTWQPTGYLDALRESAEPVAAEDVQILFEVYKQGCDEAGTHPFMIEFGQWLAGEGPFDGSQPAEVFW